MESKSARLREVKEEILTINDEITKLKSRKRELLLEMESLKTKLENQSSELLDEFKQKEFDWSQRMYTLLRSVFGIQEFRNLQKQCINVTMSNRDCILLMPTGGGKSLCFQLPAILSPGVTLVVSPLLSLIEDQYRSLKKLNISVKVFNSQTDKEEANQIMQDLVKSDSKLKLLYVTPEKLSKSKRLMSQLQKLYENGKFSRLVVDEVHCCSQWGHDFRPDYKFLGIMKRQYPNTPILGLTATATTEVVLDIQKILNIEGCIVLKDSFYRRNLKYEIIKTESKDASDLANLINERFKNKCGIVYCLTIKDTEEVATLLCQRKINACAYHAKLEADERSTIHQMWYSNEVKVIVATIAFGMGINKLDVRFVIHHSMSKSIENYYQETGRAGRDGELAHCVLFYRFCDIFRMSSLFCTERSSQKHIYAMLKYCLDFKTCRKKFMAEYFEDSIQDCNEMCDNCENRNLQSVKRDVKKYCSDLIAIIRNAKRLKERLTALKLMEAWMKKGNKKLRVDNAAQPKLPKSDCERIVALLLLDGFLTEEYKFTAYTTISYIEEGYKASLLKSQPGLVIEYDFLTNETGLKRSSEKEDSGSNNGKRLKSDEEIEISDDSYDEILVE